MVLNHIAFVYFGVHGVVRVPKMRSTEHTPSAFGLNFINCRFDDQIS